MSSVLSRSVGFSSVLKMEEGNYLINKQGIVSILGSAAENQAAPKGVSLRRTLSADMSSKKWQSENGFSSPMKKIESSQKFSIAGSDSDDEEAGKGQSDIWASIQPEKNEKPGKLDIWTSIVSQKEQEDASKSLPPPYIHPLVKRSTSSLSEKSLQICTESLGSETGSDGFSSYPPSENGDSSDKEEEQEQAKQGSVDYEEIRVVKFNYAKKSPQRSFPPPIRSLSDENGASVRMTTRRDNGRLVLEAVSVPSHNNFRVQRQDGRLVLSLANPIPAESEYDDEEEVNELDELELENFEEKTEDCEEEDEEEEGFWAPKIPIGAINVHRLAQSMNKPIGIANRNPTWPRSTKVNEAVKFGDSKEEKIGSAPALAHSLPPRPPAARSIGGAAASLNAYEYFWRPEPISKATSGLKPNNLHPKNPTKNPEAKEWGNKKSPIPLINSCKEPRRSLLSWEPHCIAT